MLTREDFKGFDFAQLVLHLQAKGISCQNLAKTDLIKISFQGREQYLVDHEFFYVPLGVKNILEDKFYFKQLLIDNHIPVQPGRMFNKESMQAALQYVNEEILWPVVIKAPDMQCGDYVFCGVGNEAEFIHLWERFIMTSQLQFFLVEKCWNFCPDYRFIIFKDRDPVLAKRTVPEVIGDGKQSLKELVMQENERRTCGERNSLCDIYLQDEDGMRCLRSQGLTMDYCPPKNETVRLRYGTNLSYGGMSELIDVSLVHNSYWSMLDKIWKIFPELPYLSVDILSYDITQPATSENCVVSEAHVSPGLGMFLAPEKGNPIDLYDYMGDLLLKEMTWN